MSLGLDKGVSYLELSCIEERFENRRLKGRKAGVLLLRSGESVKRRKPKRGFDHLDRVLYEMDMVLYEDSVYFLPKKVVMGDQRYDHLRLVTNPFYRKHANMDAKRVNHGFSVNLLKGFCDFERVYPSEDYVSILSLEKLAKRRELRVNSVKFGSINYVIRYLR